MMPGGKYAAAVVRIAAWSATREPSSAGIRDQPVKSWKSLKDVKVAFGTHPMAPTHRTPAVWLSWHDGSRSRSLSLLLRLPFRVFADRSKGFRRHYWGTLWTIREL